MEEIDAEMPFAGTRMACLSPFQMLTAVSSWGGFTGSSRHFPTKLDVFLCPRSRKPRGPLSMFSAGWSTQLPLAAPPAATRLGLICIFRGLQPDIALMNSVISAAAKATWQQGHKIFGTRVEYQTM